MELKKEQNCSDKLKEINELIDILKKLPDKEELQEFYKWKNEQNKPKN